jgi:pimeloyl-ACP methyl ester carboxylesterase
VGLAFERVGSGPPLVLFHGLGHRRQAWDVVRGPLAKHRELILVDLPGHGQSPPLRPEAESTVAALMRGIVGFLDDLGLASPHVGGSSLGGRLALELAARGRAATVTAFSPAGFWTRRRELRYARAVFWAMRTAGTALWPLGPTLAQSTAGRTLLYAFMASRPSQITPSQAMGDMTGFLAAKPTARAILLDAFPFTASIPYRLPVTIGWGTRDLLLPPKQAFVAAARLPHARIILLPGCGHVPMTDDPQLTADVLLTGSQLPVAVSQPAM